VSEGFVTLTTMYVLVFTAMLLFTLSAVGAVTDRWDGPATPVAQRADRRASRNPSGRPRRPGRNLAHHDQPNLVLFHSPDDGYSAAFEACRRDHPAGSSPTAGPHRARVIDRHADNQIVPLRRAPPVTRRSA
jgi:hypothetical protein